MEPDPHTPQTPDPADEKLPSGTRANMATWIFAVVAIVLFLSGGGYWLAGRPNPSEIEILIPTPATPGPVVAHIDGEVRAPGVYVLEPGARVEDGIEAAGGITARADPGGLNLAALLKDGQRITIPALNTGGESLAGPSDEPGQTLSGPVDLNSADLSELETLPGIGEVKAQAIIDWRNQNGLFSSADDLLDVSGIGAVTVEKLRSLVAP